MSAHTFREHEVNGSQELAPVPLGSPESCTFGPDNLSLDAYMASADFAPQSLEELQEEVLASKPRPLAPWWLWAILIAGVVVVYGAALNGSL